MALGRGLNALITSNKKQDSSPDKKNVWEIPVSEINVNGEQPRKYFDEGKLKELATSIKEHGILQPLLVVEKADGGYELVAGERRLRASKLAGLAVVPAVVKNFKNQQKLEVALIENIQREDLNPLEEAFAYKRLIDEFNLKQQEVADRVGKSRPAIANTIRLLELPNEIQKGLEEGKISAGQARAILSLKTEKEQLEAYKSTLGEKITVRDLERKAHLKNGAKIKKDPNLDYLEKKLRDSLGSKVVITKRGKRGNISIYFYSEEELGEIINKIALH